MSNPHQSTSNGTAPEVGLTPDARKGRTFVVMLIVCNTLLMLSVIGILAATGNNHRLPHAAFRLVVNIALMYGLWIGTRWIKWLFALGLLLSALFCLLVLIRFPDPITWFILPAAGLLEWAAWNLDFGDSVNEFLDFKRKS